MRDITRSDLQVLITGCYRSGTDYSSVLYNFPVYSSLFQPIPTNPQSPISNSKCPIGHFIPNWEFFC